MPVRSSLQTTPTSQVRISTQVAAWFLGSLVIASLGLILTKIIADPTTTREKPITFQSPSPH